jgi:hypothetical protein
VWLTAFFTEKVIGNNSGMIICERSPRLMSSTLFPSADIGRIPTSHTERS